MKKDLLTALGFCAVSLVATACSKPSHDDTSSRALRLGADPYAPDSCADDEEPVTSGTSLHFLAPVPKECKKKENLKPRTCLDEGWGYNANVATVDYALEDSKYEIHWKLVQHYQDSTQKWCSCHVNFPETKPAAEDLLDKCKEANGNKPGEYGFARPGLITSSWDDAFRCEDDTGKMWASEKIDARCSAILSDRVDAIIKESKGSFKAECCLK